MTLQVFHERGNAAASLPDEDRGDEEREHQAEAGEHHGGDGLRVAPPQELHRDGLAVWGAEGGVM